VFRNTFILQVILIGFRTLALFFFFVGLLVHHARYSAEMRIILPVVKIINTVRNLILYFLLYREPKVFENLQYLEFH
jgi:hypothetical protein